MAQDGLQWWEIIIVIGNTLDNFLHDEDNFLTQEEVNLINRKVKSLRGYWKNFLDYNKENYLRSIYFEMYKNMMSYEELKSYYSIQNNFGDAIYMLDAGNYDEIDQKVQNILKEEFDWLYDKLLNAVKKVYETDNVKYDEKLPLPAFHVYHNKIDKTNFINHIDRSIFDFKENVDSDSVTSFVSLIESPKCSAYLDYGFGKKTYEVGKLHFWHGLLQHKIGNFTMNENEYRITFQGHSYKDSKDGTVYLYF